MAKTEAERRRISFCGTDEYMAPELMLCMENYDQSVDIFSFGIILLALLARSLPNQGNGVGGDGASSTSLHSSQADDDHHHHYNTTTTTTNPFRRVVPGFGLDAVDVGAAIPTGTTDTTGTGTKASTDTGGMVPRRDQLLAVVLAAVDADPAKRPTLKTILAVLKEAELETMQRLKALLLKAAEDAKASASASAFASSAQNLNQSLMNMNVGVPPTMPRSGGSGGVVLDTTAHGNKSFSESTGDIMVRVREEGRRAHDTVVTLSSHHHYYYRHYYRHRM